MAGSKPTILFVPGAWHKTSCYDPVIQALELQGYPTARAELASVGPVPGIEGWEPDISNIESVLAPLVEAGKFVVAVAHSYGSLPLGEAIKSYTQRACEVKGQNGGVVHVVYISAFVLPPQTSLMDALGNKDLPWFDVSSSKREVQPINPAEIFYNDLSAQEQERQVAQLETFSYQMYFQKTTWAPYKEVSSSYVLCTMDNAIPLPVQQGMLDGSGVQFRKVMVEAGHSPFLSKVDEVVKSITGVAESL